ncbi:S8 family serine peptidase [Lentzea sp. NPDC006480]|uniref:S8 family peptidase n=1 Tax=Lentzea sp. NPDC006480 TaxID=3157176 RepID=UPI0033ABB73C
MRGKSKVLGAALAALALTAGTATQVSAAPQPTSPKQTIDEVTLVTGDKVLLGQGQQVVAIQPGDGRKGMTFKTHRGADGHTMVVPKDAFGPLAAGRLDRRLFDVTTLLEFGYRDRMPLIVDGQARLGARSSDDWTALKAEVDSGDEVWLDGIRKPTLDRSVKQIGAPAAHERGITGKGVKVAIVDTGVDENHPDLKGQQIAEKNFTTDPDNTDHVGHGTHVGSTVASHDSKYGGVAPGAQLLDAKVCVEFGCQESWILDGMRWAAEQGAQVVNMSLGGGDTEEIDPLEQAVNELTAKYGTLFVIAAGNSGGTGTVSSPSTAEAALSVGAVDRDDSLAPFSSKGPRVGDSGLKPEVTAPGVGIVAAAAGTNGEHVAFSGTSMATPHVAGAAALLKSQHPEWTPAQLKSVLATTAKPTAGLSAFDQGAGRIDVSKAINQVLTADVVAVNLGRHEWPHGDDKPETKAITYTNPTDAPITLDVQLTSGAPQGMFALGATKVTYCAAPA